MSIASAHFELAPPIVTSNRILGAAPLEGTHLGDFNPAGSESALPSTWTGGLRPVLAQLENLDDQEDDQDDDEESGFGSDDDSEGGGSTDDGFNDGLDEDDEVDEFDDIDEDDFD